MRGRAKLLSHGIRLTNDEALLRSTHSDLAESIRLNSKNHEVYNDRGAAYAMLKDYKSAISDFSSAISLKGDYFDGFNNRCLALASLGRKEEAIADCKKALRLNPTHWQPKRTLERLNAAQ